MSVLTRLNLRYVVFGVAAFALLGPPLGGIVVVLINAAMTVMDGFPLSSAKRATIGFLIASWWFGGVPAAATGLVYAFASIRLHRFALGLSTGICGAALTFAWFIYLTSDIVFSLLQSVPGFIAGLAVAALLTRMWPNMSFKPNPLRGSA
jgi:hypothetical protein